MSVYVDTVRVPRLRKLKLKNIHAEYSIASTSFEFLIETQHGYQGLRQKSGLWGGGRKVSGSSIVLLKFSSTVKWKSEMGGVGRSSKLSLPSTNHTSCC